MVSSPTQPAPAVRERPLTLVADPPAREPAQWTGPAGRVALGVIYVWFGLLKVFDVTPVTELVHALIPFLDTAWFVPTLGVVEVFIGLGLLFGRFYALVLAAFAVHLSGTFLVLVFLPEIAFRDGNPLLLTVEGEFVVKNVALAVVGMMVAQAYLPRHRSDR